MTLLAAKQIGNMRVDETFVNVDGQVLSLTAFELKIIVRLADADGTIVSLDDLHMALYGTADKARVSNVVEVIIGRLRKKLAKAGAAARIDTVRNQGYRLEAVVA